MPQVTTTTVSTPCQHRANTNHTNHTNHNSTTNQSQSHQQHPANTFSCALTKAKGAAVLLRRDAGASDQSAAL
eukprot:m.95194 g.95194  ORF g.95194 m.95194 type:complete len:73 (-) comp15145_c0_seq1:2213-2431(-)